MTRSAPTFLALAILTLVGSNPTMAADAPAAPPAAPAEAAAPAAAGSTQKYTAAELETLVGPIALYPDLVLASMLPATAAALDVVEAARYVESKGGKVDAAPEGSTWDPAVLALLQFPDVLQWMNGNLDWIKQMAFAVSVQQSDVLAAIQAFRKKAQEAGNLKSDSYMKVETQEAPLPPDATVVEGSSTEVIIIQPTDPQVIYVPTYTPAAVVTPYYGSYPPAPLYGWGLGFAMGVTGAWIGHELGWWGGGHGGDININNNWNVNSNWNSNNNINRGDGYRGQGGGNYGPNRPQQWQPNQPAQRPGGSARPPSGNPGGGAGGVRPAPGGGQGMRPPTRPPNASTRPGGGTNVRPGGSAGARPTPAPAVGGSRPSTQPAGGGALGGASGNRGGAVNSGNRGGQSLSGGSRPAASTRPSGSSGASRPASRPTSGGGYNQGSFGGSNKSGSATRSSSSRGRSSSSGGSRGGGGGGGRRR